MRLPGYKRINRKDYNQEDQQLIDRLSGTINDAFDSLFDALNNRLTFRDNFLSTVSEFSVTVDTNGIPTGTTSFKLSRSSQKVEGVLVINATNVTVPSLPPVGAVFISYTVNSDNIVINKITGLSEGNTYRIKVLAI